MRKIFKSTMVSLFRRVYKFMWGKSISRFPGVKEPYDFLFWRIYPHESTIEIHGSKMYMNPSNLPKRFRAIFRFFIINGSYESRTTEMFRKVVKKGDVVVDIGANMGYFTLLASRLVGREGKIYAFEPEPVNYGLLVKNIGINGYKNIVPVQKAVSDRTGTTRLFINKVIPGQLRDK